MNGRPRSEEGVMRKPVAFVMMVGVIGAIVYACNLDQSARTPAPPNPYLALSPEKIIEQGKSLERRYAEYAKPIQKPAKNVALIEKNEIEQTREALRRIGKSSPQFAEAQQLLASIDNDEAEGKKQMELAIAKAIADDVDGRKAYADQLEKNMLSDGMDAHVSASGAKGTTLVIRYILVSRPFLYKLMNETPFLENIKKEGFTTVHFTNGYDLNGSYDIAKNKWN
jgi:hypothetical protein